MTCAICLEAPTKDNPWAKEHLMPEFLGGDMVLPELICKRCNSFMGHTFEGRFCNSQLVYWDRLTKNIGGKSEAPKALFKGTVKGADGNRYRLDDDNTPIMVDRFCEIEEMEGEITIKVVGDSSDPQSLIKMVETKIKRSKIPKLMEYSDSQRRALAEKVILENLSKSIQQQVTLHGQILFSIADLALTALKVIYEMACQISGPMLYNDLFFNKVRLSLLNDSVDSSLEYGLLEGELPFESLLPEKANFAYLVNNKWGVKLAEFKIGGQIDGGIDFPEMWLLSAPIEGNTRLYDLKGVIENFPMDRLISFARGFGKHHQS